jgi:hypothetical protein
MNSEERYHTPAAAAAAALVLEHLLSPMRAKKIRRRVKYDRRAGKAKPISPKSQEQGFLAGRN